MQRDQVRRATRTALVLEVLVPPAGQPADFVQIVQSIPGREGTKHRTWYLNGGLLDAPTWMDISQFLNVSIDNLLTILGGAQERLPM